MKREDVIQLAREACDKTKVDAFYNGYWTITQDELERVIHLATQKADAKVGSQPQSNLGTAEPQPEQPMTETQKLREALQAISHIDDTTNHSVDASAALDRIGQIARQALALPTADHLPDAGKMVVDHFPDATKMIETAAPVGEREAFEREMSKPPFEFCMDRWPDDGSYAWPGNYAAYHTQCAWAAWQARAALSAGDAVDSQRLDFIEKSARCDPKMDGQHVWWPTSFNTAQLLKGPTLREALDNAIRARKDNT